MVLSSLRTLSKMRRASFKASSDSYSSLLKISWYGSSQDTNSSNLRYSDPDRRLNWLRCNMWSGHHRYIGIYSSSDRNRSYVQRNPQTKGQRRYTVHCTLYTVRVTSSKILMLIPEYLPSRIEDRDSNWLN